MPLGDELTDKLAYELVQTDFDAVERGDYRAAWTADDTAVRVRDVDTGDTWTYDAEDLIRATSDREVRHARRA